MSREAPANLRSLQARIRNEARRSDVLERRLIRTIANTVVGQMLPPGVIKGGTAMKVRLGERASRFTPDLDAARAGRLSLDQYLELLDERLGTGWGAFSGSVHKVKAPQPEGVPEDYIIAPFDIKLAYAGSHWLTVRFELGRDEVGSTETPEYRLAPDIVALFDAVGLPQPQALPTMAAEHQIAQKLHACTSINPKTGRNDRAHDLVDLQLIMQDEPVDLATVKGVALQLFEARRTTPWPPTVLLHDGWEPIYAEAADGLDVVSGAAEAVAWANRLIADIHTGSRPEAKPAR